MIDNPILYPCNDSPRTFLLDVLADAGGAPFRKGKAVFGLSSSDGRNAVWPRVLLQLRHPDHEFGSNDEAEVGEMPRSWEARGTEGGLHLASRNGREMRECQSTPEQAPRPVTTAATPDVQMAPKRRMDAAASVALFALSRYRAMELRARLLIVGLVAVVATGLAAGAAAPRPARLHQSHLILVNNRDGDYDLYAVAPDGRRLSALTRTASDGARRLGFCRLRSPPCARAGNERQLGYLRREQCRAQRAKDRPVA